MNNYLWLVRREFWENRAIWIIPGVIGGLLLLVALFGKVDVDSITLSTDGHSIGAMILFLFGAAFFVVMSLYSTWYLLDCLYADRKDKSVLFWKSLPVSDSETVLSKLAMALLIIPLVYFVAADITTVLIAFIVSVRFGGLVGGALWHPGVWLELQAIWLYLIVTIAIWYLPVAGWLLLVSAWANRAVMLWSLLPPLVLLWAESQFLGSHVLASQLQDRLFSGYLDAAFSEKAAHVKSTAESIWPLLDPKGFLATPATWIGVAVGAALLAATIQVRLRRTET